MTKIKKLRPHFDVPPGGTLDSVMVSKINELIDAVNKLQDKLVEIDHVADTATDTLVEDRAREMKSLYQD